MITTQPAKTGVQDFGPWTTGPAVITAATGTLTNVTCKLTYKKIGKTVDFNVTIVCVDVGTGGGHLRVALPFTPVEQTVCFAREVATVGAIAQGEFQANNPLLLLVSSTNTFPAANGQTFVISGVVQVK